jgi:hypothetical protein
MPLSEPPHQALMRTPKRSAMLSRAMTPLAGPTAASVGGPPVKMRPAS